VPSQQEHRLQMAPPLSEGPEPFERSITNGIAEVDEIFMRESFKGQRTLPRAAHKRCGVVEKPGLSAEHIPILIARDRAGAHIDAVFPNRSEAAVRPVLEGKLSKKDTLMCMDGDKALIAFAEQRSIRPATPADAGIWCHPPPFYSEHFGNIQHSALTELLGRRLPRVRQ
jgi:hypothetical protein